MAILPYLICARLKTIGWLGPSRQELKAVPEEVPGRRWLHTRSCPARGASGLRAVDSGRPRDVIEIRAQNERGDSTFRGTYTVELGDVAYVLHAFQKKSRMASRRRSAIATLFGND